MSDMLKMRTVDFKKLEGLLNEHPCGTITWERAFELLSYLPNDWESSTVLWFNENFEDGEANFMWLADLLLSFKIPYEYFCDRDIEGDDYWEYYNPTVREEPKSANMSKDSSSYLFKRWNFEELKHLPDHEFKQAVEAFFKNPFADYPDLNNL